MTNILLCGGSGNRLWPISREQHPKQFCNIPQNEKYSLLQNTLLRNSVICEKIIIITNMNHYPMAKSQVEELNIKNVNFILEPIGRNTAPAITIACMSLFKDDIVFITPSDHYIKDTSSYKTVVKKSEIIAKNNYLVTFGIKPTSPDTGFGYIEADGDNVISFHEKPDELTAKKYINNKNFFWNSGMFAFKAGVFLEEIKQYSNDVYESSLNAYNNINKKDNILEIDKTFMELIPSISIDYAVMEKSKNIKMIAADINWSDLGSFEAIYEISDYDENGNACPENKKVLNSKNNFIISNKNIALIDIDDVIVIDTPDAILISKKGSSHKIKELNTK